MTQMCEIEWKGQDAFAEATRDTGVVVKDGLVQLVRRVVLADEMGNCNGRDVERVDGQTWARKEFWLESAEVAGARVSPWVRCSDEAATLVVAVNGRPLTVQPLTEALRRTPDGRPGEGYWQDGWRVVQVPP